jgi:RimJ/RimL family protein N-acetyltransferase
MLALGTAGDDEALHWLGWDDRSAGYARAVAVMPAPERVPLRFRGRERQPGMAALAMVHGGEVVGQVVITSGAEAASLGFYVAAAHRGRGFGTAAMTAAIGFAHDHLGCALVTARAEATNLASITALERSGMYRVERHPTHVLPNGRVIESVWFEHRAPAVRRGCRWFR